LLNSIALPFDQITANHKSCAIEPIMTMDSNMAVLVLVPKVLTKLDELRDLSPRGWDFRLSGQLDILDGGSFEMTRLIWW
jgi:hypothetical protein